VTDSAEKEIGRYVMARGMMVRKDRKLDRLKSEFKGAAIRGNN